MMTALGGMRLVSDEVTASGGALFKTSMPDR